MSIYLALILPRLQQTIFKMSSLSSFGCYSHCLCCCLAAEFRMKQVKGSAGGLDSNRSYIIPSTEQKAAV